ncbi:hypothetical protein CHS0354_015011 [Potamilus streckersoni]|uniref:Uncharacterized protein n=1 Tax=Potamilus streckersoni TaxID=2493646 RepID=A0AAE0SMX5_9BIVA|nr:hypothetical protein CHS0354_015011 [Potamilus streckersoni]
MRRQYHEQYVQHPVDKIKENDDDKKYVIMKTMPKWAHSKDISDDGIFVKDPNIKTTGTKTRKVTEIYEDFWPDWNQTAYSEEKNMLQIVDDIIAKYDRLESYNSKIPLDPEVDNLTCVTGLPEDILCMVGTFVLLRFATMLAIFPADRGQQMCYHGSVSETSVAPASSLA